MTEELLYNGPSRSVMGDGPTAQATESDDVERACPEMETMGPAQDAVLVFGHVTDGTCQYFQQ